MAVASLAFAANPPGRVLVVSSNTRFRARVLKALAPQALPATEAAGGVEALLKLEENEFRTLVLDRKIHDLNVEELVATIRTRYPRVNVVMPEPEYAEPWQASLELDGTLREKLLLEHLPQVQHIARRIHGRVPPQVLLEDLVHAGILGLMDAVRKYDPSKNVRLKHYAEFRIRGAILDSLRQADWSPRTLRRQARRLDRAILDCKARFGRHPSETEIAAQLQISLESLQQLLGDLRGLEIGSLPFDGNDLRGEESIETRAGSEQEDPYHQTLRSEMMSLLDRAIEELPEREREVLALYHFKELTMKEVGVALGIGDSRVSQIHTAALLRLSAAMRELIEKAPRSRPPPGPRCLERPKSAERRTSWKQA